MKSAWSLAELDAIDQAALVRAGEVSPSELAEAVQTLAAVQPGASGEAELSGDRVPTRKLTTR